MIDAKAAGAANEAEDASKTGPISHAEAKQIAYRFFNSLFHRGGEKARISIPADFKRDDDIRLIAYIEQQQNLAASDVARCEKPQESNRVLSLVYDAMRPHIDRVLNLPGVMGAGVGWEQGKLCFIVDTDHGDPDDLENVVSGKVALPVVVRRAATVAARAKAGEGER